MGERGEFSLRQGGILWGREERILTETRCHLMGERGEFSLRQGVILWGREENSLRDKASSYGRDKVSSYAGERGENSL